jgi:hypothetical protein
VLLCVPCFQALFDHIPVGVGSQGIIPTTAKDLEAALEMGMDWSLRCLAGGGGSGNNMLSNELTRFLTKEQKPSWAVLLHQRSHTLARVPGQGRRVAPQACSCCEHCAVQQ